MIEYFEGIEDTRQQGKIKYNLAEVIVLTIVAVTAGAEHWCLDINFNEDRCRMRKDNSGENLAVICHIALNLYNSYTKVKLSMKAKRFRCSFDDDFLCSLILNKFC